MFPDQPPPPPRHTSASPAALFPPSLPQDGLLGSALAPALHRANPFLLTPWFFLPLGRRIHACLVRLLLTCRPQPSLMSPLPPTAASRCCWLHMTPLSFTFSGHTFSHWQGRPSLIPILLSPGSPRASVPHDTGLCVCTLHCVSQGRTCGPHLWTPARPHLIALSAPPSPCSPVPRWSARHTALTLPSLARARASGTAPGPRKVPHTTRCWATGRGSLCAGHLLRASLSCSQLFP